MDIRKLQRAIVDGLEDVKAQDIQVFNTEHLSPLFERVIVASGASNRQTKALAASVRDAVKSAGMDVLRTEGEENGEWIIVDCGAAVAHIMQPSIRDYYRLEEIWGGKPVAIKLGGGRTGLVKASEGADDEEAAPKPKKRAKAVKVDADDETPAKKAALKKPAARKTAAGKAAPLPRAKTPAERSSSTRGPARKTSARTAAATKPAGSQAGKAKPAPKSAAGKVAAAKKTRAGSTAARAGTAPVKAASVKKVVVPANSSRNASTAARKTAKKTAATKAAVAKKVAARRG
ncbi:MAG TPA: ribosome silencing factor [Burkholderiaceae bacterium]|nr:ribosome silencing factor [Burkholderiaceae bacterium]